MSLNRYQPHVYVLPEDDANRQLAVGFLLETPTQQIQLLGAADGWIKVLKVFKSDHVREMERFQGRCIVMLIDFDGQEDRLTQAKREIPEGLRDRVFVLGVWTEPERLKAGRTYEVIGSELARECREETYTTWNHDLLRHNANELARLRERVRPILFA